MRQYLKIVFIAGLFSLAPATCMAQIRAVNPDSSLQTILSNLKGTRLNLETATKYALEGATEVRIAEARYLAARGTVRRESGLFDPELFLSLTHEDIESPNVSVFTGDNVATTSMRSGLRIDLPVGTQLEAALNVVSVKDNSPFTLLYPRHTAVGSITLRQPLLRGLTASARKGLTRAEREFEAARSRFEQQVTVTTAEVERRYWELYAAERDFAVRQLTRNQGEALLNETRLRAQAGLIGPSQVANARTFLAEQKLLLLDREEDLDRLSDELATFIGQRPGDSRYTTVDEPPTSFEASDLETLIEQAETYNADLKARQAEVESARALAKAAGWEMLPQLDLVGSLGGNGLAGDPRDVIFSGDTLRSPYTGPISEALGQVGRRDFKTWRIGVEMSIPIGFRPGLGERQRLRSELIIAEQRLVEETRALEQQVRANHRSLRHGNRRLEAAREGVQAAQEQVRIGLIEFQNGRTTAFELVRLGADFALAQQRYSEALVRTARAAAMLKQLTTGKYGE